MRILLATTVLSAALLSACGSSAPPPPPPPAVAPIANAVTGTVALIEPRELSDAAKVDITDPALKTGVEQIERAK